MENNNLSRILPCLFLKNNTFVKGFKSNEVISDDPVTYAMNLSYKGADKIVIFDLSKGDKEHDEALTCLRNIIRAVDCEVYGAGNVKRSEDIKKLLYAGCKAACLNLAKDENVQLIEEVSKRFGKKKIMVCVDTDEQVLSNVENIREYTNGVIVVKNKVSDEYKDIKVYGVEPDIDKMSFETSVECKFKWSDLKKNADDMIPVIVQDYKTEQVLMMAYMNEEAFNKTLETSVMTYFSRSRNELWVKGLTSGHYQYVKDMYTDCDKDTILVHVAQVGAACHTGSYSCFFNEGFKKQSKNHNPSKVFDEVYATIMDRKENPKEGSYTNYLFDKGVDKILKKVGEEATEIVIAAKNPDKEEIKYEIADFLYHVMVLMAEKDVTWEDITEELANR